MMYDRKDTTVLLKFEVDGIHFSMIKVTFRDLTYPGNVWYWHVRYDVLIYGYGSKVNEKHVTIGSAMNQIMDWMV